MELNGKTIIITGASSGIGKAAALLFSSEGANLVIGARREPQLKELKDQIELAGGNAVHLAGDVTSSGYAFDLVDVALSKFGGLDGAFNNAGIMGENTSVPEMSEENWQRVIDTNLSSAFYASRAQIPALQKQGGGSLVFTSSFVGFSNGGMPGKGAYAASKAGMIGLVKSMASQHAAQGIRINALLPGATLTEMLGDDQDTHNFIADLAPVKRLASAREIAQGAVYLLSDRSSFVNGTPFIVDGAMSVRLI